VKLVYITASFPFGKGESFIIPEIEELAGLGNEIEVIPFISRGNQAYFPQNANIKISNFKYNYFFGLFHFIYLIIFNFDLFSKIVCLFSKSRNFKILFKNVLIIPLALRIGFYLNKNKPNHIHVHWGGVTSTAGIIIGLITNIKWSITCHRWDIYEDNLLSIKSKYANFIRFISKRGLNDSLNLGVDKNKSFVSHMGVYFNNRNEVIPYTTGDFFNIVCPANLIDVKGHIYLLKAIKYLISKNINVTLSIVGDGYLMNKLNQFVTFNLLNKFVTFRGNLKQSELFELYKNDRIHCVVLPSLDLGNGLHEGIPVSLIEAISFKKLVISTKTGSIPELLLDNYQVTVNHKSHIELANKIEQFYFDPELYNHTCNMLHEEIQKSFSITTIAKSLIDKFNS
jgi:glycosyltransferase involved in cell wall biosynthesis